MFIKKIIIVLISALLVLICAVTNSAGEETSVLSRTSLSIEPKRIDFSASEGEAYDRATIQLEIRSTEPVKWVAAPLDDWVVLDEEFGIMRDMPVFISVSADTEKLKAGRHESAVIIKAMDRTRVIPVTINVSSDSVTVNDVKLEGLRIESGRDEVRSGEMIFFSATGIYSDGTQKDVTDSVKWISSSKRTARFIAKGVLNGDAQGNASIYGIMNGVKSSSSPIRVTAPNGFQLRVSEREIEAGNIEKGRREEFTVNIRQKGRGDLEWAAVSNAEWISINPEGDGGKSEETNAGRGNLMSVTGKGRGSIKLIVDTSELEEGEYRGVVSIRSNGGEEQIVVRMNVVTLESISINPVSIRIGVGQKRRFKAIGTWSDGSKSDVSRLGEGIWDTSDDTVGSFYRTRPVYVAEKPGIVVISRKQGNIASNIALVEVDQMVSEPVMLVEPREIDMGPIGPEESSKMSYQFRNVGAGNVLWTTEGPEGWTRTGDSDVYGAIGKSPRSLRITVSSIPAKEEGEHLPEGLYPLQVRLDSGNNTAIYKKYLQEGAHREMIKVESNGGDRHLFFKFELRKEPSRPAMKIMSRGIDFGSLESGKSVMKKVELRNLGKSVLKWETKLQGRRKTFQGIVVKKGRYLSFQNSGLNDGNAYVSPTHLRQELSMSDGWISREGYPAIDGQKGKIEYAFDGTGIVLFALKEPPGAVLKAYIDGVLAGEFNTASNEREWTEYILAEELPDAFHSVAIEVVSGSVQVGGLRISSSNVIKDKRGWLRVFPDRGTTTHEIDYCNVMIDSKGLSPGIYTENVFFYSNGGDEKLEVSIEIKPESDSSLISIYRYVKGADVVLSGGTSGAPSDYLKGYARKGLAFSLFSTNIPGTRALYAFRNPVTGAMFFSLDEKGEDAKRKLTGYVLLGSIGNIATVKLKETRELYRWYNPEKERYFFTTDIKGEGYIKTGFRYDGMIGYVR